MKWFRFLMFILVILIDIMSVLYLIKLVVPFGEKASEIIMFLTLSLIILSVIVSGSFFVFSIIVDISKSIIMSDYVSKFLNIISIVLFFLYSIVFAIQTHNMERGSDEYMVRMYPGFIPMISGALISIASKSNLMNKICTSEFFA